MLHIAMGLRPRFVEGRAEEAAAERVDLAALPPALPAGDLSTDDALEDRDALIAEVDGDGGAELVWDVLGGGRGEGKAIKRQGRWRNGRGRRGREKEKTGNVEGRRRAERNWGRRYGREGNGLWRSGARSVICATTKYSITRRRVQNAAQLFTKLVARKYSQAATN